MRSDSFKIKTSKKYVKYTFFGLKYDNTTIITTNFNGGRFCKFLDDLTLPCTFLKKMDFRKDWSKKSYAYKFPLLGSFVVIDLKKSQLRKRSTCQSWSKLNKSCFSTYSSNNELIYIMHYFISKLTRIYKTIFTFDSAILPHFPYQVRISADAAIRHT